MRNRQSASRMKYSIWARRSYSSQEKMQAMSIEMGPAAFEAQRSRLSKATPRLSIAT
ncbi:MAG: hypothetical protein AABX47_07745 [Nanoarchaeota archaeon]